MAVVYLIRHGDDNDAILTAEGAVQSRAAGQAIFGDSVVFPWGADPHVLSSPRPRARLTAEIIAHVVGASSRGPHDALSDGDPQVIEEACNLVRTLLDLRGSPPYILVTHEPTVLACLIELCCVRIDHMPHGCVYRLRRYPGSGRRIIATRLLPPTRT